MTSLPRNINTSGRILRASLGVGLIFYAVWQTSWIAFVCALFLFFEASMSWCAVRHLFNKKSC